MSRRTKLLITAFFFLLLAIPVVHLFLTWAPENPLSFRWLSVEPVDAGVPFSRPVMDFEVENTSGAPIHLWQAVLITKVDGGSRIHGELLYMEWLESDASTLDSLQESTIPPHGTVRVRSEVAESQAMKLQSGESCSIQYTWVSKRKYEFGRLIRQLRSYLPKSLHALLPTIASDNDITPFVRSQTSPKPTQQEPESRP